MVANSGLVFSEYSHCSFSRVSSCFRRSSTFAADLSAAIAVIGNSNRVTMKTRVNSRLFPFDVFGILALFYIPFKMPRPRNNDRPGYLAWSHRLVSLRITNKPNASYTEIEIISAVPRLYMWLVRRNQAQVRSRQPGSPSASRLSDLSHSHRADISQATAERHT